MALDFSAFNTIDIVDKHSDQISEEVTEIIIKAEKGDKGNMPGIVGNRKQTITTVTSPEGNEYTFTIIVHISDGNIQDEHLIEKAMREKEENDFTIQ